MWFDLVLLFILVLSTVFGYRRGFVHTFLRAFSWVAALLIAFFSFSYVNDFILARAGGMRHNIVLRLRDGLSSHTDDLLSRVPAALLEPVETLVDGLAFSVADGIASIAFSVAVFLAVVLIVRLAAFLLGFLFSKRSRGGIVGAFDGLFGLAFGALRGAFIIFVLLALMLPVSLLIGEAANDFVAETLFSSFFASFLYDCNPLLGIIDGVLAP